MTGQIANRGLSIAGRKHHGEFDYYQTPAWATRELLTVERFPGSVLEPCSGAGAMSRILEDEGLDVDSSDIRTDDTVYGLRGVDVFEYDRDSYDHVITNPPYKCAEEVARHSLTVARHKVALLLKLTFLESTKRSALWRETPLRSVYVFRSRVTMHPEGTEKPKNGGTITYGWFVWDNNFTGKPTIGWVA